MSKIKSIITLLFFLLFFFSCKTDTKEIDHDNKFTNSLINETSPYLLQHAHNPVDWIAWSKEALEKLKNEKKLIIVSIGYSSCHWCHVMEKETFKDEDVAKVMNENFINIKVDREERPDIDYIYQTAAQLINENGGGWPLNVIMLPNGKPIYVDTYHTKERWLGVLTRISKLYKDNPEKANEYSDLVTADIRKANIIEQSNDDELLSLQTLEESIQSWKVNWDLVWGGEKVDQKFIVPSKLGFLLDYAILNNDDLARKYVKTTLDKIAMGGIYDHIGGGVFRYSIDKYWKIPHFEKMLYDNAQLLSLYSKAYVVFKEPAYKKIVLETAAFLEREMKSPEGGYYASIDADNSLGVEGEFYTWTEKELQKLLKEDFTLFSKYFNVIEGEVWENGSYILNRVVSDENFIIENSISNNDLKESKDRWQKILLRSRLNKQRPNLDDKIVTSWNALLINGLLDAHKAFGDKKFLNRAESIFSFINKKSLKNNQLVHSYKKSGRRINGFLEDYSFMVNASLNLYGVTLNKEYLHFAQDLNERTINQFDDEESGMFRYSVGDELISKIIKTDDSFIPSPNSVMAHNLFKLGHIQYNKEFLKKSKSMLSSMISSTKEYPSNYYNWNALFLHTTHQYYEIVVVGSNAKKLIEKLNQKFIPNTLLIGSATDSDVHLFENRYVENKTYIYVCKNNTCMLPVESITEAISQLNNQF